VPPKARKRPRSPHLKAIGDRIRALREQRKWSQEHLAHLVGVDRTYQSDVERGMRNFGVLLLFDLAKALKAKPEDLFS
jgi:transcriptional regulator with XRE-family HTH domain